MSVFSLRSLAKNILEVAMCGKGKTAGDLLDLFVELSSCMYATFLCLRQINWYRPFVRGVIGKINLPYDSAAPLCCWCRSLRILHHPLGTGVLWTQPDQTHGNDRHTGSESTTRLSISRQRCSKGGPEGASGTVGDMDVVITLPNSARP